MRSDGDLANVNEIMATCCYERANEKRKPHTHFKCDFEDVQTREHVMTNQKGYRKVEILTFHGTKVVEVEVESRSWSRRWKKVNGEQGSSSERKQCTVF